MIVAGLAPKFGYRPARRLDMRRWISLFFIVLVISATFVVDRATPTADADADAEPLFLLFIGVFAGALVALCVAGDRLSVRAPSR